MAATKHRAGLASVAGQLRAQGLKLADIATMMDISLSYAGELIRDPFGIGVDERRDRMRGVCVDCSRPTSWSRAGSPSVRCASCEKERRSAKVVHGARSSYNRGCRCDDCRRANTVGMREYVARKRRGAS